MAESRDVSILATNHETFIVTQAFTTSRSNYSKSNELENKFVNLVPGLQSAVLVGYLFIFVVGSIGNGLTIYVVGRYAEIRMKSVANYYIWNLAFADFFFVLTLPLFVYATYTNDWPFGTVVCKLSYAVRETNKFVSVFTLVALSVDRFMASYYSLGYLRTVPLGRAVCATIWISFAALTTPYWLHCTVVEAGRMRRSCRLMWPPTDDGGADSLPSLWPKAWTLFLFTVGFLAPFAIIFCAYVGLGIRIRRGSHSRLSRLVKTPSITMTKTTLAVAVLFLLTHLPYYIMELLNVTKSESLRIVAATGSRTVLQTTTNGDDRWMWGTVPTGEVVQRSLIENVSRTEMRVFVVLTAIAKILGFVSSCFNPVIYGLLNHNYREFMIYIHS